MSPRDTAAIDDATWVDLDMDLLFDRLDGTITPIGRQYLYRQLRTFETSTERLQKRYQTAQTLRRDQVLRQDIQLKMWLLKSANASSVTTMLFGELPDGAFPHTACRTLAGSSTITLLLAVALPSLYWLPGMPALFNFLFAEKYAPRIGRHSVSFVYLRSLLTVVGRLSRRASCGVEALEYPSVERARIRRLRRQFVFGGLDSTSSNIMTAQIA